MNAPMQERLVQQRNLLQRLAAGSSSKQQAGQLLSRPLWDTFQLDAAYGLLNALLAGLEPKNISPRQMPNGAAFVEWAGNAPEGLVPDLRLSAELALVWGTLGVLQQDRSLIEAFLKLANWQLHTLDHRGLPYHFLWSRASDLSIPELLAFNERLFSLAHRICGSDVFSRASQMQTKALKSWEVPQYPYTLAKIAEGKVRTQERYPLSPFAEEATLGLAKFHDRSCSACFALSGFNSGMGAFQKTEVGIVNFGPQIERLDDLSRFGIARSCSLKEKGFSDLIWEKQPQGVLLKGWTKAHALDLWMEATMAYLDGKLKIKIQFDERKPRDDLWWVFHVQAQKASISGGPAIDAYTLDRYEGPARAVVFSGEQESLSIEPHAQMPQGGRMKVVPLAGGNYFWGAEFLLAYKFPGGILKFSVC